MPKPHRLVVKATTTWQLHGLPRTLGLVDHPHGVQGRHGTRVRCVQDTNARGLHRAVDVIAAIGDRPRASSTSRRNRTHVALSAPGPDLPPSSLARDCAIELARSLVTSGQQLESPAESPRWRHRESSAREFSAIWLSQLMAALVFMMSSRLRIVESNAHRQPRSEGSLAVCVTFCTRKRARASYSASRGASLDATAWLQRAARALEERVAICIRLQLDSELLLPISWYRSRCKVPQVP
jgi:hypothetical protein